MAAHRPTEDSEFVLQADDIDVADVQEVRRAYVRREILILDFEPDHFRVVITAFDVVDRHAQALALWMGRSYGTKQVRSERGDAALARQMVAHKRDLADFS